MQSEWARHLLALYGAVALSSLLALYLWLSARVEQQRQARRQRGVLEDLESDLAAVRAEAQSLRAGLAALEDSVRDILDTSGALVPPAPARSGLNLSARSQVLRRHRFGEPPAEIAASLGLPRAEVDLLLKVNRIVVASL